MEDFRLQGRTEDIEPLKIGRVPLRTDKPMDNWHGTYTDWLEHPDSLARIDDAPAKEETDTPRRDRVPLARVTTKEEAQAWLGQEMIVDNHYRFRIIGWAPKAMEAWLVLDPGGEGHDGLGQLHLCEAGGPCQDGTYWWRDANRMEPVEPVTVAKECKDLTVTLRAKDLATAKIKRRFGGFPGMPSERLGDTSKIAHDLQMREYTDAQPLSDTRTKEEAIAALRGEWEPGAVYAKPRDNSKPWYRIGGSNEEG